ncbi:MAG: hypothetical protein ABSG34_20875, partial [Candidatus Sulfotelmatobacter sp.]
DKKVDAREAMMNLAMSQIMTGSNFWDAPGHSMAGSNDLPTRKKIFTWIQAHEKTFYLPRSPIDPVGVYFSPETRNYFAKEFIPSYRGALILLMQKHLEFQIVTPRTLADFKGKTIVLPDVRVLGDVEQAWLKDFVAQGGKVVIAGSDTTELGDSPNIVRLPANPGKAYNDEQEKDFDRASPDSQKEFFAALAGGDSVKIEASTHVATSIARTSDGHINCYFANFAGLVGGSNPIQTPQEGVQVTLKSKSEGKAFFLPFMGEPQPVKGERHGDSITFTLPTITRGAVFSYEP